MFYKVKPWQVVKAVYDMCRPVGMGYMQYTSGDMSQEQAEKFVENDTKGKPSGTVCMDYVGGRQCKFHFKFTPEGCELSEDAWYDHTLDDLNYLHNVVKELESA